MTKSSLNRIVRQFGELAKANIGADGKPLPAEQIIEGRRLKPLVFGFKHLPHADKMAAKRQHRERLAAMAYSDPSVSYRIGSMVAATRAIIRRNGVGPKPLFKRFLVSREAA